MKFNIITFGCKVNSYESEYIKEQMLNNNFIYVNDKNDADIIIVNTCSVTNIADNKCMKMIRSIRRDNNDCVLMVCGCSSENNRDEYKKMGIDILLGNRDKRDAVNLINNYIKTRVPYVKFYDELRTEFENMKVNEFDDQTRAFVKIQDGCNNYCTYCVIPYVRGSIRSKAYDETVKEIKELVDCGHKEIVFTGIDTGAYGKETGKYDLVQLIREISKFDKLERIRVSSIEITTLSDEFIEELKNNKKVCGHLHISLQSGSERILKMMNRKYTKQEYLNKVNKLREARPDINLTTDVIVGFPGETEEEFKECIEFCKEVRFSKIHVFPYSIRKGTKAALMSDQLPNSVKKDRARKLIEIDKDLQLEYNKTFVGKTVSVLVEEHKNGRSIGHTENFLKVIIEELVETNTNVDVLVEKAFTDEVFGKCVK
ncbi:MAG: tRNA (N(6)-L-threonylcarbamoyladenosine(37)-C(2))-methylthiotransferase MtaB [Candidatus Coprovivens sp.]